MSVDLLAGLTEAQRAAVTHTDGPCLVIAGAGTGKTTVLTRRIAYLIQEKGVNPEHIVALTFTEKAASEMEERVDLLLPYGVTGTTISTFHSYAADLTRRNAVLLGIDSQSRLLGSAEEMSFLRAHIDDLPTKFLKPHRNPIDFLHTVSNFMSRAQDEFISPEKLVAVCQHRLQQAETEAEIEKAEILLELAHIYQITQKLYKDESVLSYGSLLYEALTALEQHPSIKASEQARIKYLMIDEFQDTNTVQNALALALAEQGNIQVVGDDDQAIYRFRGANIENILSFSKHFPERNLITLRDNFRSNQAILDAAYTLIQHNNPHRLEIQEQVSKQLISHLPESEIPEHLHFAHGILEYQGIAARIKQLIETGTKPEHIAILVRAKTYLKNLEAALKAEDIPYQLAGDTNFYNLNPVKIALSYLRVLTDPHNDLSLYFTLQSEPFSVEPSLLQKSLSAARYENSTLFDYLEKHEPTLEPLLYLQKQLVSNPNSQIPSFLFVDFLTSSKWRSRLIASGASDTHEVLSTFYQELRKFEEQNPYSSLLHYIEHIDLLLATEEEINLKQEKGFLYPGVQIMTIHKSKGLEFEAVFVPHLVQGRFPSREMKESWPLPEELVSTSASTAHIEEERRLAYVAFTRAKRKLFLTTSDQYEERKTKSTVSPFIAEAFSIPTNIEAPLSIEASIPEPTNVRKTQILKDQVYSASALATFQECPQKYRYQEIFKLKVPNSHFSNFGISIHDSLREWFIQRKTNMHPNLSEIYEKSWVTGGYESKAHEDDMYTNGLRSLQTYIEANADARPLGLEVSCRATLKDGTMLRGRIDRIDKEGDDYTIIDYKTGLSVKKAKDWQQDIPLFTYLKALEHKGQIVKEIQLHYVLAGEKVIVKKSDIREEQVEKTIQEITSQIEESLKSDTFGAKPDKMKCSFCDYKAICPFRYGNPSS